MLKKIVFLIALLFPALLISSTEGSGVSPDEAISRLKKGNFRFENDDMIYPRQDPDRRDEVLSAQKPFATILSCSDSRVPVEIVFDAGIGDLFVIRVAGNVADTDEVATAEYGVAHLGTQLLLVLGHSSCGAVTAVVKNAALEGSLPQLLDNIAEPVKRTRMENPQADDKKIIAAAIKANIFQSIADLIQHSEVIRSRVKEGKLKIVGGLYDLESGKVSFLGEHPAQKELLSLTESTKTEMDGAKKMLFALPYLHAAAAVLIIILSYFLFAGTSRLFRKMKMKWRLMFSFLTFVIVCAFLTASAAEYIHTKKDIIPYAAAYGCALVLAMITAAGHINSFRIYFQRMVAKYNRSLSERRHSQ